MRKPCAQEALSSIAHTVDALTTALQTQEQTEEVKRVLGVLTAVKTRQVSGYIFDKFLSGREPKFLYFDEYYQMTGHER